MCKVLNFKSDLFFQIVKRFSFPRFTGGGSGGMGMLLNVDGIMNDNGRSTRALEFILDGEDENVPDHHPRAKVLKNAEGKTVDGA